MDTNTQIPTQERETGCCPRFDPARIPGEVTWTDKPFVKEHVHSVMHVPLDMGRRITKAHALIEAAHAEPEHPLLLSEESSAWGADLYLEVDKDVPGAQMTKLSGTFLTKVFEGPYSDAPKWADEMRKHCAYQGRELKQLYFNYTTCPKCAKAYGKNFVVLFARVN